MSSQAARERYFYKRTNSIEKFCNQYGFSFVKLNNGYQVRIENVVDVYPVNGRFHWLQSGERGEWDNSNDLRRLFLDKLPGGHPPLNEPRKHETQYLTVNELLMNNDKLKEVFNRNATVHAYFMQAFHDGNDLQSMWIGLTIALVTDQEKMQEIAQNALNYSSQPPMFMPGGILLRNDGKHEYYGHTHMIWLYKFIDWVIGKFK